MKTLRLRFDDEAAAVEALPEFRHNGEWMSVAVVNGNRADIDIIGAVKTAPGEPDADGLEVLPPTIDVRFHANLLVVDDETYFDELPQVDPTPSTPARVFAGL